MVRSFWRPQIVAGQRRTAANAEIASLNHFQVYVYDHDSAIRVWYFCEVHIA